MPAEQFSVPVRVSVVCANLDKLPIAALEFLVLHVNTLQRDVEYQFLPVSPSDPFLASLAVGSTLPAQQFEQQADDFVLRVGRDTKQLSGVYGLKDAGIGRLLVISLASLKEKWYEIWKPRYSAIFLGDWDATMAPPSLLESILSLVLMEGLYALLPDEALELSHLPTRGCIGDFNASLRDVRYKTLQGFLCGACRSTVQSALGPERTATWVELLGKGWLGDLTKPQSPVSTVAKLGYSLFVTRGLAPTRWERLLETLTTEGTKEVLKLLTAILVAALLIALGLKGRT